jgi:hypothetical protein
MYKFSINQVVFVKPLNREGIVTGQRSSFTEGQPPKIEYKIAMSRPSWQDHCGGIMEYVGQRYDYVRVHENDVIRIEDAPAPTWKAEELGRWGKGVEIKLKECECGTEKHGFANHSTWCPKA